MKREDVLHFDYHQRGIQFCSPHAGRMALFFRIPIAHKFLGLQFHASVDQVDRSSIYAFLRHRVR